MRTVNAKLIEDAVKELFIKANYVLPQSVCQKIGQFKQMESDSRARSILGKLEENAVAAVEEGFPICQDTGMAVVFMDIGNEVYVEGGVIKDAVDRGVRAAYDEGYLRKSVVAEPFFNRVNTGDNTPSVLYINSVPGDKIHITAAPKGFGSENMSRTKMFTPSAKREDIVGFAVETVKLAGGNPCPPIVIGMALGGTFDYCAVLSKKALARDVAIRNPNPDYAALEAEILERVNATGIGPQGFGGDTTALAVNIEYAPTHIAGLPCAINIGCHVTRHAECEI